jgi:hypothetical protein
VNGKGQGHLPRLSGFYLEPAQREGQQLLSLSVSLTLRPSFPAPSSLSLSSLSYTHMYTHAHTHIKAFYKSVQILKCCT